MALSFRFFLVEPRTVIDGLGISLVPPSCKARKKEFWSSFFTMVVDRGGKWICLRDLNESILKMRKSIGDCIRMQKGGI